MGQIIAPTTITASVVSELVPASASTGGTVATGPDDLLGALIQVPGDRRHHPPQAFILDLPRTRNIHP